MSRFLLRLVTDASKFCVHSRRSILLKYDVEAALELRGFKVGLCTLEYSKLPVWSLSVVTVEPSHGQGHGHLLGGDPVP